MTNRREISGAVRRKSSAVAAKDRSITFLCNDQSVARDNNTILSSGIRLDNFKKNPVLCWNHESSQPPLGRFTDLYVSGEALYGTAVFATADVYPFADVIYRMYQEQILNAVSISWVPIKYSYSKTRSGGIDFVDVDLLEISCVSVPALATAIAVARSRGIAADSLERWMRSAVVDRDTVAARVSEVGRLRERAAVSDRAAETALLDTPADRARRIEDVEVLRRFHKIDSAVRARRGWQ